MKLSAIFHKPIDRPIEGVIKADDEAGLATEVEEYVLTAEIERRLEEFLAAYNNYEGANGVWISGFFGSGKSHLLKMLALLLENRTIDGDAVLDRFLPKCGDNEILRADLKRAAETPSRSILFNIDQKADVISKSQVDALLAVFVKVFDEMCGYYGRQGHIAQFERDLDSRSLYDAFKQAYREVSGLPWETGREQALLEGRHIAAAYAQVTGASSDAALGILDKYRAEYKLSIEDFAVQVRDYVEAQGPNFRLNFFVDEAGQYIADNVKLMTNLQTVAESLATKCRGRSWIAVTAQEDMDTVLGEMGRKHSNDFSKIQDRFRTRMKLTSADVAEVIRKRLLQKNEQGIELLTKLYREQQNNFRTLFDFSDGSITYRTFRDREEFIHSYPFIPYQFSLFQSAIQNLSQHSAFEGHYSSVGERSMLAVFQQVALQIAGKEVGRLATFDLMFEGIRATLKSQIQRSILTAEEHLSDDFAVKVLKALFLVKYVKEFKATPHNLTVLMLSSFDADLPDLRRRVQEALNVLEQQTYVQRSGDEYEYLTDEEKDIEQEIKNTEVETDAVADELSRILFDYVIRDNKIRYDENGQDYAFTRKLDDRAFGRTYELAIHVASPFNEHAGQEEILRAQSMGRDELLVILPPSDRLYHDLVLYKKTEKYIRQNMSVTQQESVKRILNDKGHQNGDRMTALRKLAADLLAEAKLIAAGQEVEAGGSDAKTRVVRGFHELLVRTYPNLRMLAGVTYTEAAIGQFLRQGNTLFGSDETAAFSEAEQEMAAFIESNQRSGLRTTMKMVVERFERKPYGWYPAATQCVLAKLCGRGRVDVRRDSNLLEVDELDEALRSASNFAYLVLEPQVQFTTAQVRRLKDFYANFFDTPTATTEAKTLGKETAEAFGALYSDLVALRGQAGSYPFLVSLDDAVERIGGLRSKPYTFYLVELLQQENALFDLKEKVIDPVRRFMAGSQRQIYDEAQDFLVTQDANFAYIAGDEVEEMRSLVDDPACHRGAKMTQVKTLLDSVKAGVQTQVERERAAAAAKVDERWARLADTDQFAKLSPEQQAELESPFTALKRSMQAASLIPVLWESLRLFDDTQYPGLLRKMAAWAEAPATPSAGDGKGCHEPRVEYITQRSLTVAYEKPWLENEADVEAYVAALKQALMDAVHAGKRVAV